MYSYKHFRPGGSKDTSRIIKYITEYNRIYGNDKTANTCYCVPDKYDKTIDDARTSYPVRISQTIRSTKGGNIEYGNFYLGKPMNVNYLGRMEGMPGGSGTAPVNRF